MTRLWLAACLLFSPFNVFAVEALPPAAPAPSLQNAAQAYREGRWKQALEMLAEIVDKNPQDTAAKSHLWTIAQQMRRREAKDSLSPGELAKAEALALRVLDDRRRRAEAVLSSLKTAAGGSRPSASPSEILASVAGLEKSLGREYESARLEAEAQAYIAGIQRNLAAALKQGVFLSRKDHHRAAGHLAYIQGRWEEAVKSWTTALKEDPSDPEIKRELGSLQSLIRRRKNQARVAELAGQAETYHRTGYYAEALENWEEVRKLDPDYPGLVEKLSVNRAANDKEKRRLVLRKKTDEGVAAYKAGRYLAAAETWLQVLQEDPAQAAARDWLKQVGPRLEAAREVERPAAASIPVPAQPATSAERARAEDLYKKGLQFYAEDRAAEAVEKWKECLRLDPAYNKAREALKHAQAEMLFK